LGVLNVEDLPVANPVLGAHPRICGELALHGPPDPAPQCPEEVTAFAVYENVWPWPLSTIEAFLQTQEAAQQVTMPSAIVRMMLQISHVIHIVEKVAGTAI
jgi:hypothetical protein